MSYDVIVIGASVDGLATATALARGGARVLLLDASERIGGAHVTAEFAPGWKADIASDDAGWVSPRLVQDLQLEQHGLRLASPGGRLLAPTGAGAWLEMDAATLSPRKPGGAGGANEAVTARDRERWPSFAARVGSLSGFLAGMSDAPVPDVGASSIAELLTAARLGVRLKRMGERDMTDVLRVLPMSIAEWLDDWFESPTLKGVLASRSITHLCHGPRAGATTFSFLQHAIGRPVGVASQVPQGGVGALTNALAAAARAAGVQVRTGAKVERIVVKQGVASGVVLAGGEELPAARIASAASPRSTFLELCDPTRLEPDFVRAVRNIRYRGAWAKVHLALDALPPLPPLPGDGPVREIVVAPTMDYLERAYDDAKYGRVAAAPFLRVTIPTVSDPSLAPPGKHIMSVHMQYAPYRLREGAWDSAARTALGERAVATLAAHLPGIRDLVLHTHVVTPADLESEYGLPEGHLYHGEMALDQVMFMRPVPACASYRSPVQGVYVCGPGAHPGGGIAGGAGLNAARVILGDVKRGQ